MNKIFLISSSLMMLTACSQIDITGPLSAMGCTSDGRHRLISGNALNSGRNGHAEGVRRDTSIFIAALEFPDGYDWRRDTAYGNSGAAIAVYRGKERVLTLRTGRAEQVGWGADMHHLIGGHLISEYVGSDGTVVKNDGVTVFKAGKGETLRGLLFKNSELYSLSRKKNGRGFVLRRGSETVLDRDEGDVIGSPGEDCHFRNGALYIDRGKLCFAFRTASGAFIWTEDMDEQQVAFTGELLDLRSVDGEICILSRESGNLRLTVGKKSLTLTGKDATYVRKGHISVMHGVPVAIYEYVNRNGNTSTVMKGLDNISREFQGSCIFVENDTGNGYGIVSHIPGERLLAVNAKGDASYLPENSLWFGARACCSAGEGLIVAYTPYDAQPMILNQGRRQALNINGFITAVSRSN